MQIRFISIFIFCILTKMLSAQTGELMIEGTTPNLYLVHTVSPKENWYSLGRLYNASPKEIAPYNGLGIDKPLNIGQQVKVPLQAVNFVQNVNKTTDEALVPIYHILQDKEWLYRVSVNYNKVPVEMLEKWNNITNDQAKAGMKLIVGYLKVKKKESALASVGNESAPNTSTVTSQPEIKTEEKKAEIVEKERELVVKPAETAVKQENKELKQRLPVDDKKIVEEKTSSVLNRPVITSTVSNVNGGFFRSFFEPTGKSAAGVAGIFKSTSGWQDTKFYALMDNVAVGMIIRVSNPATGKIIFAKVLGELPDMKESIGLIIRISDAASSELGVGEGKFSVAISY